MIVSLISIPLFYHQRFSLAVMRFFLRGGKMRAFAEMGKTKIRSKSRFSISANLLIFLLTKYIHLFHVWKWSDCVRVYSRESGSNLMFVCEKECTSTTSSNWGYVFKKAVSLEIWNTHPWNWPFCRRKLLKCQKTAYCWGKNCSSVWTGQTTMSRSECMSAWVSAFWARCMKEKRGATKITEHHIIWSL